MYFGISNLPSSMYLDNNLVIITFNYYVSMGQQPNIFLLTLDINIQTF